MTVTSRVAATLGAPEVSVTVNDSVRVAVDGFCDGVLKLTVLRRVWKSASVPGPVMVATPVPGL